MRKNPRTLKHLCKDCGKPIIPYEEGYSRCGNCFFKSRKCKECGRQIIPYRDGYTLCRNCFFKSQNSQQAHNLPTIYPSVHINKENLFIRIFRGIWHFIGYLFVILIVSTFLFFWFGGWSLIQNGQMPNSLDDIKQIPNNIVQSVFPEVTGAANPGFPYWSSKTITYSFSSDFVCDNSKVGNIKQAFNIIEKELNNTVHFEESNEGKLVIRCYPYSGSVSGLTTIQIWDDERISDGTIDFYKIPSGRVECTTYPTLEIHEILHALGVAHINSEQSIMYLGYDGGIWNPCRELDKSIAECLMNIYSNGRLGHKCDNIPHQQYQAGYTTTTITQVTKG